MKPAPKWQTPLICLAGTAVGLVVIVATRPLGQWWWSR